MLTALASALRPLRFAVGIATLAAVACGQEVALQYGTFDPLLSVPAVPPELAAAADVQLWIVQFAGLPADADRAAVASLGAGLHGYLPQDAYVVRMPAVTAAAVARLPVVRWVGAYEPAYRLDPALRLALAQGIQLPEQQYNIVVVDKHRDKPALAAAIRTLGGVVVDMHDGGGLLMSVQLDQNELLQACRLDQVLWIDPWSPPEPDLDNARIQSGANYVEGLGGWTGTGVRGHVYEGVEWNHPDFTTPMTNVLSSGAADDHGHATAGIVFGNGTSNPAARGPAPAAVGFYTNYLTATASRNAVIGTVVNTHQCMFTTASWGYARTRGYTSISADADDIVFDHRIPWTQSQSNARNQDSRPEAWAKNVFSIGGIVHFDNSNAADDSWAAGSASTGPAADGRIKPDLCAYYDAILCSDRTGAPGFAPGNWQSSFNGTSGATPICAGINAIAIQMYTDGLFGNPLPFPGGTRFQNRPLAQTLKALQIANAQQYAFSAGSTDNRREHQGWGFPSLRNLYDRRARIYMVAENDVVTQGSARTHVVTVPAATPELKICMTFVDPSGNPAAALAAVNDLTLRVTAPGGARYWGNQGLTNGNYSTPGGAPNTVDTVENVFVQNPAAGAWTVEVIASRIAQDAHLATPQVDATYALCCVGGTGVATGGSSPYAASAIVGTGCAAITSIPLPRTFCEQFGPFDLAWSALRFHPNGIGGWDATPCAGCFARGYGGNLGLGDDALARNLALGFAFPLPGGGYTSAIDIDANGWVGLVPYTHAASDPTETVAELLANPRRIAVCWDNLDPSAGGGVYFDPLPGVALVTWAAVPEFLAGGANTAQLQLYPNGEFVLAWQAMSIADCIVGHSVGGGVPDPGARNLSNAAGITLLTLGASALPMLGTSVALTTTNYPAGALLSVQALGLVGYDPGLDLGGYGMPGCRQYARIDATGAQIPAGGQSVSLLSVPNYPSLLGLPVHAQSFAFAPGINTAGVVSSNGVRMLVGH